ncbi:C1 family peptidase [Spirosoma aureum]|uniref:C1 family peptidase n=1 Tax=Spirosoma aureum TaxID=2692134 RepID=A0A6G9AVH1_9BACT|nr:C1 family peptidase [Spirosoma aureum]QIP16285.1 C1 family peptidase [Spirosoma aureum]
MKISWLTGILVASLTFSASAQTDITPGLLLDDAGYEQVPYQEIVTKEKLPSQVSFESFCPAVQAQGAYSTCTGFACGYYLRTILEAKSRQITAPTDINKLAFSPGYLYEKAKSDRDYACTEGVYLSKVFSILKEVGVVPFRHFPYPACGQQTVPVDAVASRYRIREYERLFNVQDEEPQKIYNLKKALAAGSPVVVGMVVPASFFFAGKVWKPASGDDPKDKRLKGHALCIIGYDDKRHGGAFRVINSFGKAWADGGFCWISYHDMARFTRYGFKIS